ncbi:MAG TPA: DUF523 and DUF1722 domain-containing protein [Longimicrobiales bacterium]|nr:DUF523 and DUF1722 domain-containing protein [Longimicrobiales bacterium]
MHTTDTEPTFPRPRLVLSECLELSACRYNGQRIPADIVNQLAPHVDLVPVCPEVRIGLGVPRDPIRLVALEAGRTGLAQPSTGRDLSALMDDWSAEWLAGVGDVDGFLLKSRSPSCGPDDVKVYAGVEEGHASLRKEPGRFAAAVRERFPAYPMEDEGRLTNLRIREQFLTRIFALAAFRAARERGRVADLVAFHASHKFVLLVNSEPSMRELGRLVAGAADLPPEEAWHLYGEGFRAALDGLPARRTHLNVLQHAAGYVTESLSADERAHFGGMLEVYGQGKLPLSAPVSLLQSWIARFQVDYLANQAYFRPFPPELMDLRDSGRGRL